MIKVVAGLKIEILVQELMNNPAAQVVLEVAPDAKLLANEVNLRLVKFYAEEADKELIVKATDPTLISLAQRVGISTICERRLPDEHFSGTGFVKDSVIEEPTEFAPAAAIPEKAIRQPGGLVPALLVALFTIGLAVWWFLQPLATVLVYPKEQYINFTSNVLTGTSYDERELTSGKIPAKLFEKNCTLKVQTKATGTKIIGVTPAVGKVMVINSSEKAVVIPKGTVFTSKNGLRFLADHDLVVPKKVTKFQYGIAVGEEYGRAEVPITAAFKGASGNLSPKMITKVSGAFQSTVTVVNLTPTTKGTDQRVAVIALSDQQKGEAEAKSQMLIAGPEEAAALVDREHLMLSELLKLQLLGIKSKPDVGETADSLETQLDYQVAVISPAREVIHKYLLLQLNENIPENFEPVPNGVQLVSAQAVVKADQIQLKLVAKGKTRGVLDERKIREALKGKSLAEGKKALARLEEVADFQINPKRNVGMLPAFGFQIRVLFPSGARSSLRVE